LKANYLEDEIGLPRCDEQWDAEDTHNSFKNIKKSLIVLNN